MKKIFTVLICILALCLVFAACEKDKEEDEKEIEFTNETTEIAEYNDDDPDNGYSDIMVPDK